MFNKNPFRKDDETIEENEVQQETIENEEPEVQNKEEIQEENNASSDEIQEQAADEAQETDKEDEKDKKYEELNNKYIRLAADFDNYRKRTALEKEELSKYTTIEILKKITTVLDTFDRAKEHLKDIDNCQTVKDGYEMAYKQLTDTLSKLGLVEIEALGADFNPQEHEAITQVTTDEYEPDTVAMVAQKGYKLGDKVVRPALVGVAKKKDE